MSEEDISKAMKYLSYLAALPSFHLCMFISVNSPVDTKVGNDWTKVSTSSLFNGNWIRAGLKAAGNTSKSKVEWHPRNLAALGDGMYRNLLATHI